ncbi:MAG: AAA family ATPase [Ilumatobacteraceae bacterium]
MIQRGRLLERVGDASLVAVVAPSGFGKSTFADQLVAAGGAVAAVRVVLHAEDRAPSRLFARVVEAAGAAGLAVSADGLPEAPAERAAALAAAIERVAPKGAWVVLDDVHHADDAALSVMRTMVERWQSEGRVRVALVGRTLPWAAAELDAVMVDEAALAFDRGETELVFAERGADPGGEVAMVCRRRTNGWPAAVALWAAHAGAAPDAPSGAADERAVFDALLRDAIEAFTPDQRGLLAQLPLLSPALGTAVGWPAIVDDLMRSGLPVRRVGDWWSVGDVVRDRLSTHRVPGEALVAAAAGYATNGQLLHALDLLFGHGLQDELPGVLARLTPRAFEHTDLVELSAALEAVAPQALAAHPEALLVIAQVAETRAMLPLRNRLLDRMDATASVEWQRLIEVERVRDLAMQAEPSALDRGRAALAALPATEPAARARCLYALGWAASLGDDPDELLAGAAYFAESAGVARACRRDDDRARALSALAYRVHLKRGEYDRSIARFEEALTLMRTGTALWAATLTFLAESFVAVGRDDEAMEALSDARAVARQLGDVRTLAYCAWNAAKVAARRRDTKALHHWLAEADANHGDWYAHLTGAEFCAVAADLCAQCGDLPAARQWLARTLAHPRLPEYPDIAWPAECSIEVRAGEPVAAEALVVRLLEEGYTEYAQRWRYRLWIAWCRHRAGDAVGAQELVAAVQRAVAAAGQPDLPSLHEPEMWAVLSALDGGVEAPLAALRVEVLSAFAARDGATEVAVPSGKPAQLLKVLAVMARPVPVEEMAELLWPDVDPDVGRRRLRNVVARVRAAGAFLDRADDLLVLSAAVAVDVAEFDALAQSALRARGDDRAPKAMAALAAYRGELLPADRFEEWTVLPRERLRTTAVRLAEAVLAEAADRADPDLAVTVGELLLSADPYADHIAEQVADVLRAAAHTAGAAVWAERAQRIRRDLGF